MTDTIALPSLGELRVFMKREGWTEGPPGSAGSLWAKDGHFIGIPSANDESLVRGAVERMAEQVNESFPAMTERIRYYGMDIANLGANVDEYLDDTIPLDVADVLTRSARMLIRSSATTAAGPRGDIRGNYSRFSDELLTKARMGHTKRGSFIIPIIVPLPDEESNSVDVPSLDDSTRVAIPEPYERRAFRTLAQSLQAVRDVIIKPGKEPTMRDLHAAVELGLSREFCVAVCELLTQPAVSSLSATFSWGGLVRPPGNVPHSVTLAADGSDLVRIAAEKLKDVRTERSRTFSGNIVALRHVGDDPDGYITVATVRHGRLAEVMITLPYPQYREALQWHYQAKVVLVEGDVTKEKGRLVVNSPTRCHPIEELYLLDD